MWFIIYSITMKSINGYFIGQGGFNLYYRGWLPKQNPRTIVFIIHGLAEHSGRYTEIATFLVEENYCVFCHDHQGHGFSGGSRGYIRHFATYTKDLISFIDIISEKYPHIPIFLLGHSIGGTIAIDYCIENQGNVDGLILSAPTLLKGESIKKWQIILAKILSVIAPKAGVDRLDSSTISKDPAVVNAYRNDKLVYSGKLSARLGSEILKTIELLPQEMNKIKLPVLIMQGSEDKLVSPDGSKKTFQMVSSTDKTLKIYEGLYHEIMNEPEKDMVYKDISEWISKRLSLRKGA
ncbi:MAG: lysophospholipase [Dehalococcoidia bacterium]|nr:MAG: lysophospholipase [Dehalococcoidia bacterium]